MKNVTIYKSALYIHKDSRRTIEEYILPAPIPFEVKQVKLVYLKQGKMVGNHYHPIISNRWELFISTGEVLFSYRYYTKVGITKELLNKGDICIIPPGYSHLFIAEDNKVCLLGMSNKIYNKDDAVVDILI